MALPIVRPDFTSVPPFDGLRITWLGHSTVLVQFDDICVLTDPIFSERASPSQMVGPKRYREAPCNVHDLPHNLDAVVISHSHYDHLDLNTVVMLNARFGSDLRWFVPLGLGMSSLFIYQTLKLLSDPQLSGCIRSGARMWSNSTGGKRTASPTRVMVSNHCLFSLAINLCF